MGANQEGEEFRVFRVFRGRISLVADGARILRKRDMPAKYAKRREIRGVNFPCLPKVAVFYAKRNRPRITRMGANKEGKNFAFFAYFAGEFPWLTTVPVFCGKEICPRNTLKRREIREVNFPCLPKVAVFYAKEIARE
jgi:hypothetical protein